jgi:hypothetical protein
VTRVTHFAVVGIVRAILASVFNSAFRMRNAIDTTRRINLSLQPIALWASESITSASWLRAIYTYKVARNRVVKDQFDTISGSYSSTGKEVVGEEDSSRSIEYLSVLQVHERC